MHVLQDKVKVKFKVKVRFEVRFEVRVMMYFSFEVVSCVHMLNTRPFTNLVVLIR